MSVPVCYHKFHDWGVSLLCPTPMASASHDDIMIQTNGCGRDGLENRLVPDTVYGLDISPVCRVHDWMYQYAQERSRRHQDQEKLTADERFADGVFAMNLVSLIQQQTGNKFLRWLRLRRAHKYVNAVALTEVLRVLPRETLVAIGYGSATEALGGMIC